jgi:hypothetical protein
VLHGQSLGWPVFVMLDAPFAEGSTRTAVLFFLFHLASAATCRHAYTPAAGPLKASILQQVARRGSRAALLAAVSQRGPLP